MAVTDAESVLREYPQCLRDQGVALPDKVPTGGMMAYKPLS